VWSRLEVGIVDSPQIHQQQSLHFFLGATRDALIPAGTLTLESSVEGDASRTKNAEESPGVHRIEFQVGVISRGEDSVDPSTRFSESGLDLWEIADTHDLEDQPVDLGFHSQQSMGSVALPTS
jgi:hypothetical protein